MERIKKKNILLRIWERLGESDIDDNEYEGMSEEDKRLLYRPVSALEMLKSTGGKKGGKNSNSSEKEENIKSISDFGKNQSRIIKKSRDEGMEIGE